MQDVNAWLASDVCRGRRGTRAGRALLREDSTAGIAVIRPLWAYTPGMATSRLGPVGIAVAIFVLIALILAAFFCAFPWGMTVGRSKTGTSAPA